MLWCTVDLAGGRVTASPYAKKLAREAGVDISDATPSGLGGRIVAADVEQLIKSGAFNTRAAAHVRAASAPWGTRLGLFVVLPSGGNWGRLHEADNGPACAAKPAPKRKKTSCQGPYMHWRCWTVAVRPGAQCTEAEAGIA
jgi:pyruvate/2-oxoglutarate dehydrogenase complex dihydrolipoamide acyltransferase (E2) component